MICACCRFPVKEGERALIAEAVVHDNPVCLGKWASLTDSEKLRLVQEAERLQTGVWKKKPLRKGEHWARRPGCNTLLRVVVDDSAVRTVTGRPLPAYEYEFLEAV